MPRGLPSFSAAVRWISERIWSFSITAGLQHSHSLEVALSQAGGSAHPTNDMIDSARNRLSVKIRCGEERLRNVRIHEKCTKE
jgi:hypothetical protein